MVSFKIYGMLFPRQKSFQNLSRILSDIHFRPLKAEFFIILRKNVFFSIKSGVLKDDKLWKIEPIMM